MRFKIITACAGMVIAIGVIFLFSTQKPTEGAAAQANIQNQGGVTESATSEAAEMETAPKRTARFNALSWNSFVKPQKEELRKVLTSQQYKVTQEDGTELPFKNEYNKNYKAGIYVDIVSGEPLYFSKDKYDSGTGWPSFVKPISPDVVTLKEDNSTFPKRTEVRSRYADSHIGHVFDDGPADRGGKRYCMNSAALRFIPKTDMEQEGYGYLLPEV